VSRVGPALLLVAFVAGPAAAQTLDAASLDALGATLRVLQDPAQRGAALDGDPRAAQIDSQVRALAGSDQLLQEFYGLVGQVFEELVRGSGGDVGRMNETLARAQGDPAAIAALLSRATLERLRRLSSAMSDRRR
jgi:hypothetical protein